MPSLGQRLPIQSSQEVPDDGTSLLGREWFQQHRMRQDLPGTGQLFEGAGKDERPETPRRGAQSRREFRERLGVITEVQHEHIDATPARHAEGLTVAGG